MRLPSFQIVTSLTLAIWILLVILTLLNSQPIVDNIISLTQLIFYVASLLMIKKVYQECDKKTQRVLFPFLAAIFIALITDAVNYSVLFIFKHANFFVHDLSRTSLPTLDKTLYTADYIEIFFWYIIVFFFLINLLRKFFVRQTHYRIQFDIFAVCLTFALVIFLYLSQPERLKHASFFTFVSFISSVTEIATFMVAIYGLIHSRSWSLYLLLSSMVIMIFTQISALFYYSYHIQDFLKLAYISAPLWIMMIFLTFNYMHQKKDYDLYKWFVTPNSLEARLAFSTLVITSLSFITFLALAYTFNLVNEKKLLSFFLFLIIYSLFVTLAAKRIALFFARPFKQLQTNIAKLMASSYYDSKKLIPFEVAEFDFLQKFIYGRFMEHEAQNKKIKLMGEIAMQVAHDIRSPVAAIMMLVQNSENLPEEQRVLLRGAATRVQDIANNILTEYQQKHSSLKSMPMMLMPAILSVISEKRVQYHERKLKITLNIDQTAYFAYIKINPIEFKRVFSNLINNAVEALDATIMGNIEIILKIESEKIMIRIQDNGHGINADLLKQLNSGYQVKSSKKEGLGLGLQHAKKLIQESEGFIRFESNINKGTAVILLFKILPTPCWIAEKIYAYKYQRIIILDDDETIHAAWDQRFKIWKKNYPSLILKHFYTAIDCLTYINSLDSCYRNSVLLLSDYELINQNMSGLDVIEQSSIRNAILVTSYYDNVDIIKRAILANAKILPKILASDIEIIIYEKIEKKPFKQANGVLLDNQENLSDIIQFLAKNRKTILDTYSTPYQLWENLARYPKDIVFYLDYDLELPVNGIDIAECLYVRGYRTLYLATGFEMKQTNLPAYLKTLPHKMALLDTIRENEKEY